MQEALVKNGVVGKPGNLPVRLASENKICGMGNLLIDDDSNSAWIILKSERLLENDLNYSAEENGKSNLINKKQEQCKSKLIALNESFDLPLNLNCDNDIKNTNYLAGIKYLWDEGKHEGYVFNVASKIDFR